MNLTDLQGIVDRVAYLDRWWHVDECGHGWLVQIRYNEKCVESGRMEEQHGRKWYVSPHATESEVVQTCLLAAKQSAEHVVREHFTYMGARVFGPHFNVHALERLARDPDCQDHREPMARLKSTPSLPPPTAGTRHGQVTEPSRPRDVED